ncbi:PRC-barrel domain-containing protein [Patescibacteria group bacterium]
MLVNKKQLIGLKVLTKSEQELGVICDFELDPEQHTIVGYLVKKSKIIPGFISEELIVRPKQVISVTAEQMIVDDMVIKDQELETATQPST